MGRLLLGSQEVCPVVTIPVKVRVPEGDFTLAGNELRKAQAWTNVQNGAGKVRLGYLGGSSASSIIWATDMINYNGGILQTPNGGASSLFIVNGSLYQANVANSVVSFTLYDSDTDWEQCVDTTNSACIKNGVYYDRVTYAQSETRPRITGINLNGVVYPVSQLMTPTNNSWVAKEGILYYGYTPRDGSGSYPDAGAGWEYFYSGGAYSVLGLKNQTLTYFSPSLGSIEVYDSDLTPNQVGLPLSNSAFICVGRTRKKLTIDTSGRVTTTNYPNYSLIPDKIFYEGTHGLSGNILFRQATNQSQATIVSENIKDVLLLVGGNNHITLESDGKLKIGTFSNNTSGATLLDTISAEAELVHPYNYAGNSDNWLMIRYPEEADVITTIYTTTLTDSTNAYVDTNVATPQTITARTTNTITVGGKVYTRDTSKDSTFSFVPTELSNHIFNDQELCQIYLNAGLQGE